MASTPSPDSVHSPGGSTAGLIDELRAAARRLHRDAQNGDATARKRIGGEAPPRRRDALAAIARELGFRTWPHLKRVLEGKEQEDFGSLLVPSRQGGHTNIWCADYAEARAIRAERDLYLLPHRRDFVLVEASYLPTLGVDAADPDWDRMGRDWARPRDLEARARLYAQIVRRSLLLAERGPTAKPGRRKRSPKSALLPPHGLEHIGGRSFEGQNLSVTGREFVRCTFRNCRLLFAGGPGGIDRCRLYDCEPRAIGLAAEALKGRLEDPHGATIRAQWEEFLRLFEESEAPEPSAPCS